MASVEFLTASDAFHNSQSGQSPERFDKYNYVLRDLQNSPLLLLWLLMLSLLLLLQLYLQLNDEK